MSTTTLENISKTGVSAARLAGSGHGYRDRTAVKGDKAAGLAASFILHLFIFTIGSVTLLKPAQYGVEQGFGGLEVSLTAAPAAEAEPLVQAVSAVPDKPQAETEEAPMALPDTEVSDQPAAAPVVRPQALPAVTASRASDVKGDGSSPIPGRDATTFYSGGGAQTDAKPSYLRNPAPRYPEAARRLGQEGVVLLTVQIDPKGKVAAAEVRQSSGHALLDGSALKAVRGWRFEPARAGSIAVESKAQIPIRFQLNDRP